MEKQDITLLDLLIKSEQSIKQISKKIYNGLLFLIKLSYSYFWIIFICISIGGTTAYFFHKSIFFKKEFVTTIRYPNGMDDEVKHAIKHFMNTNFSDFQELYKMPISERKRIKYIQMVNAIDTYNDGTIDFYDYNGTIAANDSLNTIMHDRTRIIVHTKGLKSSKNISQALNLFFINNPTLKFHYKRFHKRDLTKLNYLDKEIKRLDSLSNKIYFHTNNSFEIQHNLIITPADKQLFYKDIIELSKKRDRLNEQISAANERVVFEYDFIVSSVSLKKSLTVGAIWGLLLGYLISLIIKKRKPIQVFLKK